jgi:protein-S-isoprenylcysteine O-methyltransferase Ste14
MRSILSRLTRSRSVNALIDLSLTSAWIMFAYANLVAFLGTGAPSLLLFTVSEALQALFFAIRRQPKEVESAPSAWAMALIGTFAVLLLRPGGELVWSGGGTMILVGFTLQIWALSSLNTSFSIVPANRGVKTRYGYAIVRHPIYATYMISTVGYLLLNASIVNAALLAVFVAATIARIHNEERLLFRDPAYASYAKTVPYRLVPFVY